MIASATFWELEVRPPRPTICVIRPITVLTNVESSVAQFLPNIKRLRARRVDFITTTTVFISTRTRFGKICGDLTSAVI